MQQGSRKKKQSEARRKFFMSGGRQGNPAPSRPGSAPRGGGAFGQTQPPQGGGPSGSVPPRPNETLPGTHRPIPQAQIQPHQVVRRTGDVETPMGRPAFAPQSNTPVSAPFTPPQESREVQPRQQVNEAPVVDVTVILYSSGQSPHLLAPQIEALRRQSVHAAHVGVHVDGPHQHDERTLARLPAYRTPVHVGRYFRIALARHATTRWVAILDEDTMPGRLWLERTLETLQEAEQDQETPRPFGAAVLACAGSQLAADDPAEVRVVGPEFPSHDVLAVDYGRQGYVFATEFARVLDSIPRAGHGSLAFAFSVSMAAASAQVPVVVLDYGNDRDDWPSTYQSQIPDDSDDVYRSYEHYRNLGWQPQFFAAPRQGFEEATQLAQAEAPPAVSGTPAWAQPEVPQEPDPPPAPMGSGVPPAVDAQGNYPPGARVTHQGHGTDSVTLVETVIPREHSTPRTGNVERVLQPHEQTQRTGNVERVLHPAEATQPPPYQATERIVGASPPPLNQREARVVGSSPPPAYQSTERVIGQPPGEPQKR